MSDLDGRGAATISEVRAYGDVVLRFISFETEPGPNHSEEEGGGGGGEREARQAGGFTGAFLPNFVDVGGDGGGAGGAEREDFGLQRADHIVGNVWDMLEHVSSVVSVGGTFLFCVAAHAEGERERNAGWGRAWLS